MWAEPTPPPMAEEPESSVTTRLAASAPVLRRVAPADRAMPLLASPSDESPLTFRTPAVTLTPPLKLLAPVRFSVPAPAVVSPALPARIELMVAAPLVVVMVGAVPASVSVLPLSI